MKMVHFKEQQHKVEEGGGGGELEEEERSKFCINDNVDIVIEILKKLDAPSLGVAACVCTLWSAVSRTQSIWENLCFRGQAPRPSDRVSTVVSALGGYRSLYMACVRPVRLSSRSGDSDSGIVSRHEVQLSLSLFCVDYFERMLLGGDGRDSPASPPPPSLCFLRKTVNV
ncbi:unnamed protein product [Cuscuta europaea]|uniref:F-box domain-containing protein n=1 Tax=Cuscuta europaea TaxID=41803 RepID=A0A9P0ZVX2_CUSEU|nr:unnamed protein product [Cuscuta europaea]